MVEFDNVVAMDVAREGDDITIICKGALDLHNYKGFHEALIEASDAAENVLVDFFSVDYIDTAVLASLARAGNKMMARGKRLKVKVAEPSHPLRTLQITGFSAVLDVITSPKQ